MTDTTTNPVGGADAPAPEVDDEATLAAADTENTAEAGEIDENGEAEGEGGAEALSPDDELIEVDRAGKKYKVPKLLHGEMLMQADYTRKTQALAQDRDAIARDREAVEARRTAAEAEIQEDRVELGKVFSLQTQLDAWKDVDWDALEKHDRDNGTQELASAMRRHTALKDALAEAEGSLKAKQEKRTAEKTLEETRRTEAERQEDAKLVQDGFAAMKRDFPDWSPEVGQKTMDFGVRVGGFSAAELNQVRDPRMIKVLHLARIGQEALSNQRSTRKAALDQQTKPAPTVAGIASVPKGEPKNADDWVRQRNKQVAERRAAGRRR